MHSDLNKVEEFKFTYYPGQNQWIITQDFGNTADLKDKLSRRNMQIKDLKKKLSRAIYEKDCPRDNHNRMNCEKCFLSNECIINNR